MTQELFASYSFLLDRTARKVKQYAQQQFPNNPQQVSMHMQDNTSQYHIS